MPREALPLSSLLYMSIPNQPQNPLSSNPLPKADATIITAIITPRMEKPYDSARTCLGISNRNQTAS